MADDVSTGQLARDIDRHETELREVRAEYVRKDVYQAALDRIAAIETKLASAWLSNRNALLAVASVIGGIVVAAYLGTKGGSS